MSPTPGIASAKRKRKHFPCYYISMGQAVITAQWQGLTWGLMALLQASLGDSLSCLATCVVTEASAEAAPVSNHSFCNIWSPFSVTVFFRVAPITFSQCQYHLSICFWRNQLKTLMVRSGPRMQNMKKGFEAGSQPGNIRPCHSHSADIAMITSGRWWCFRNAFTHEKLGSNAQPCRQTSQVLGSSREVGPIV